MTLYEALSILVSAGALVTACLSMRRAREAQKQQEQLNRVVEQLSEKQLQHLERTEAETHHARVTVEMGRELGESCFVLVSCGAAAAHDVSLTLIDYPNPNLLWGPSAEALPLSILNVGQRFDVYYRHLLNDPVVAHARTGWIDPDGERRWADFTLSFPVH